MERGDGTEEVGGCGQQATAGGLAPSLHDLCASLRACSYLGVPQPSELGDKSVARVAHNAEGQLAVVQRRLVARREVPARAPGEEGLAAGSTSDAGGAANVPPRPDVSGDCVAPPAQAELAEGRLLHGGAAVLGDVYEG